MQAAAILMKALPGPLCVPSKAAPKAKAASRAGKPRGPATKAASPPKAGAKARPAAKKVQPRKKPTGTSIPRPRGAAGWQQQALARVRALIREAEPGAVEEVKWRKPSNGMQGVPTWSLGGIICTGETYKDKVKLTFAKGARLEDPEGLFNASLDGGTRRAIDIREGGTLDGEAFKELVRAAVAENSKAGGSRRVQPP